MTRSGGLGRGLDALIPAANDRGGLRTIGLDRIEPNPRQPRDAFNQQELAELAQSLQTIGLLQPIVVREIADDDRYQIIAGERRFRAAELAGFSEIRAVVRSTGDDQVLTEALVENIHRVDLNALEEAAAYQQLLDDFGFTHEQLAARLGKSRSAISNTLRLLGLPPDLQRHVVSGALRAGHARSLLAIDDPALQRDAAQRIVSEELSVRASEQLVKRLLALRSDVTSTIVLDDPQPYAALQRRLSDVFSTKVRITGTEERGQVVIDYAGAQDLQRLLGLLEGGVGGGLQREPAALS